MRLSIGISSVVLLTVIVISMFSVPPAFAVTSSGTWSKTYGGPNWDVAYALAQTIDGGYALAGITESFGAGAMDFWLVRTDVNGNMLWNKAYGGKSYDYCYSMVQTSDGGYALAGGTSSGAGEGDFMLVKTDANGGVSHFPLLLILGVSVGIFVIVILLAVIRAKRKWRARAVEHESVSAREG